MSTDLAITDAQKIALAKSSEKMNRLELALQTLFPPKDCPVTHHFTRGNGETGQIYTRTILMKAGSIVTSKVHRWEHPFFVMTGSMTWFNEDNDHDIIHIQAPYFGITKPGTRRAILIHEDVLMSACYATHLTDVAEIERTIIEAHYVPENIYHEKVETITAE